MTAGVHAARISTVSGKIFVAGRPGIRDASGNLDQFAVGGATVQWIDAADVIP